jgi:WASH complex subunit 7
LISWLTAQLQAIVSEAKNFSAAKTQWQLTTEANLALPAASLSLTELGSRLELLLYGLRLAGGAAEQAKHLLAAVTALRNQPLPLSSIVAVGQLVAGLREMEQLYSRHSPLIGETVEQSLQHTHFLLLNLIKQAKKSVISDRKYTEAKLDILSCLILAERALAGPATRRRAALAHLTIGLAVAGGRNIFREADLRAAVEQLARLDQLNRFWEDCDEVFSFDFLCWNVELLGVVLADLYSARTATSVPLVVEAWTASAASMAGALHTSPDKLMHQLQVDLAREIQTRLVNSLCCDIETELRLTVHHQAGLQLDDRNPFSQPVAAGAANLLEFLHLPPLELPLGQRIFLRAEVAAYLERTFYNLTTVALADWRTYGEMRQMAASRLGLETVEDHLPAGTLEQGLDLLEVMRNIGRFTAAYSYNLHGQFFVERVSSNKHLNTLNVR